LDLALKGAHRKMSTDGPVPAVLNRDGIGSLSLSEGWNVEAFRAIRAL
jgi:hypothetical protein